MLQDATGCYKFPFGDAGCHKTFNASKNRPPAGDDGNLGDTLTLIPCNYMGNGEDHLVPASSFHLLTRQSLNKWSRFPRYDNTQ